MSSSLPWQQTALSQASASTQTWLQHTRWAELLILLCPLRAFVIMQFWDSIKEKTGLGTWSCLHTACALHVFQGRTLRKNTRVPTADGLLPAFIAESFEGNGLLSCLAASSTKHTCFVHLVEPCHSANRTHHFIVLMQTTLSRQLCMHPCTVSAETYY